MFDILLTVEGFLCLTLYFASVQRMPCEQKRVPGNLYYYCIAAHSSLCLSVCKDTMENKD
ncbi:hypothetical protein X556_0106 [Chlamydia pneumoniae B21]|nr:hypothetical protein X556_0106 [Chlamydia pneumoniae B21]